MQVEPGLIQHPQVNASPIPDKENSSVATQNAMGSTPVNSKSTRTFGTDINQNISKDINRSDVCASSDVQESVSNLNISDDANNTKDNLKESKKKRRERTTFTKSQINALQEVFSVSKYPDVSRREALSQQIGIPESRIQVWFKNRRAKNRKECVLTGQTVHDSSDLDYSYQYAKPVIGEDTTVNNQTMPTYNVSRLNLNEANTGPSLPLNFALNHGLFGFPQYLAPSQHPYQITDPQGQEVCTQMQPNPHVAAANFQSYPTSYVPPNVFNFTLGQFNPQPSNMYFLNSSHYPGAVRYFSSMYRHPNPSSSRE